MPNRSHPRLLVSACLLGRKTRYDASDKYCEILASEEFKPFEMIGVCPEVEIGLGIPRTPINLHLRDGHVELITQNNRQTNVTPAMREFCRQYLPQLKQFCGIVLKKNSPSCGIHGVKLYQDNGSVNTAGIGEFAYQIRRKREQLNHVIPMIDESELADFNKRAEFLQQAWASYRAKHHPHEELGNL